MEYFLIFGAACIGFLLPYFCVAVGGGGSKFPIMSNFLSMVGCASIAMYVAFGA